MHTSEPDQAHAFPYFESYTESNSCTQPLCLFSCTHSQCLLVAHSITSNSQVICVLKPWQAVERSGHSLSWTACIIKSVLQRANRLWLVQASEAPRGEGGDRWGRPAPAAAPAAAAAADRPEERPSGAWRPRRGTGEAPGRFYSYYLLHQPPSFHSPTLSHATNPFGAVMFSAFFAIQTSIPSIGHGHVAAVTMCCCLKTCPLQSAL